jgi:L-threonylcarbamoyladenylate synthase
MHNDIKQAVETLRQGGAILYPTDTIWGLGCDATNEKAVNRILNIKKRTEKKSMMILVSDIGMLQGYIKEMPDIAWDLIEYAEKPLTLIFANARNLAPTIIAEDGSIGIRVVQDEFARRLIERFRKPIVSTSANISGEPNPEFFDDISEEIKDQVDYIVNWRQEDRTPHEPSSIIKLKSNGEFNLIRK